MPDFLLQDLKYQASRIKCYRYLLYHFLIHSHILPQARIHLFYCHNLRLVIEVDGEIHTEKEIQSHDEGRTGELERFGIKVLRFTNNQILNSSDLVVEKINAAIKELTTTF